MKLCLSLLYWSTTAFGLDATVNCLEARTMLKRQYVSIEMSSPAYMPGEMLHGRIRLMNTETFSISLPILKTDEDYSFEVMYQSSQYPGLWITTGGRQPRNLADLEKKCFRQVETVLPGESRVYATYGSAIPFFDQKPGRWLASSREGIKKIQFEVFDMELLVDYVIERPKTLTWLRLEDRRLVAGEFGSDTVVLVAEMQSGWLLLASARRFTDKRMRRKG
jgi:hypothetical protein